MSEQVTDVLSVTLSREVVRSIFLDMCSEVSERCYCAGWIRDHEQVLPSLCAEAIRSGRPQAYGLDCIFTLEARTLTTLAEALGGWEQAFAKRSAA